MLVTRATVPPCENNQLMMHCVSPFIFLTIYPRTVLTSHKVLEKNDLKCEHYRFIARF